MAEEFDHLPCPICGRELLYSEGTHDLGCINNPKPIDKVNNKEQRTLHENTTSYGFGSNSSTDQMQSNIALSTAQGHEYKSYRLCDKKNSNSKHSQSNMCELDGKSQSCARSGKDEASDEYCVFGISFTESAKNGTLWSIRIVDGETDYQALVRLMQNIEKRLRADESLAANVPNLPKKVERSKVSKLAFRYSLEIEDLYSIKYSTETIERLAMFYNLTSKEVRHIKQTDIMED
ncbi:MAG: hypothetical protein AAF462_08960 [Thermodesulfobacteriota bacterium]